MSLCIWVEQSHILESAPHADTMLLLLMFRKKYSQIYACWLLILLGKALKCWAAWTCIFIKNSKPRKISWKNHLWSIKNQITKPFTNTCTQKNKKFYFYHNFLTFIFSWQLADKTKTTINTSRTEWGNNSRLSSFLLTWKKSKISVFSLKTREDRKFSDYTDSKCNLNNEYLQACCMYSNAPVSYFETEGISYQC